MVSDQSTQKINLEKLSEAAETGDCAMTGELIEKIRAADPSGAAIAETAALAMQGAAYAGHAEAAKLLMRALSATPEDKRPSGVAGSLKRAITIAAKHGRAEIVDMLIRDPAISPDIVEDTIFYAAINGHAETIQRNAAHASADILKKVVPAAAQYGHEKALRVILDLLSSRHQGLGEKSGSALEAAIISGSPEIIDMILPLTPSKEDRFQSFLFAAKNDYQKGLSALLPQIADREDRLSALARAAENGNMAIMDILLDALGPEPLDATALQAAALRGQTKAVKRLLGRCDPKQNNSLALRSAASGKSVSMIKALLPHSDPRAMASAALRNAATNGSSDIVKVLLPHSDAMALDGAALYSAVSSTDLKTVQLIAPHCTPKVINDALERAATTFSSPKMPAIVEELITRSTKFMAIFKRHHHAMSPAVVEAFRPHIDAAVLAAASKTSTHPGKSKPHPKV